MNNEVAVRASVEAEISGFEMKPRSLDEAMRFCELMADSDLVPNSYKGKPGNIAVAIQMGAELGLTPMRALRCIAVINGRASMWGDELLAMVLASPACEYVNESESTDKEGVCRTKRKGCVEQVSRFTLEDAKRAGLLGKAGTWQTHTKRMLMLRARGFALRDTFADVLAGLVTVEEALDIPQDKTEDLPVPAPPPTLKKKLKAQVETTAPPAPQPEDRQDTTAIVPSEPRQAPAEASTEDATKAAILYSDRIALSQSISEVAALKNAIVKDTTLTMFGARQLQDEADARIAGFRKKK